METTMIQIKKSTAKALKNLKQYSKQSYDEVISTLLSTATAEALTEKERKDIEEALKDIKAGRYKPIEEVASDLGVTLKS